MQDVTAEIADENREKEPAVRKSSNGNIALQHCYGQIGISAVAAAVRYQGDRSNSSRPVANAPAKLEFPDRPASLD
jgi:hypothetical protein